MRKGIKPSNDDVTQEVPFDVVVPFYLYAALFFLISCVLLLFSTRSFMGHHFHPDLLAITHAMALGCGTMIILGASYQLVPVLIESRLENFFVARCSFWLAALGIPFLVYGFYTFHLGWVSQIGGIAVNLAIILYVVNMAWSVAKSKNENIHAVFMLTASCWLLLTTLLGLLLLFNFTRDLLPRDSLYYLSLHAHLGIVGWFLLLVIGVGSRLIPLFLISKYTNVPLLWTVYILVNLALLFFMMLELNPALAHLYLWPVVMIGGGVILFFYFVKKAYDKRIKRRTDDQMKVSLAAIGMFILPILILTVAGRETAAQEGLVVAYGFCVFFGWLTAIILGMTFKTLPFIVWSKTYRSRSGKRRNPDPRDLFDHSLYKAGIYLYALGFVGFLIGILFKVQAVFPYTAGLMILSAALYVWNVLKVVFHKAKL